MNKITLTIDNEHFGILFYLLIRLSEPISEKLISIADHFQLQIDWLAHQTGGRLQKFDEFPLERVLPFVFADVTVTPVRSPQEGEAFQKVFIVMSSEAC